MLRVLVPLAFLCACGALSPPKPDGGSGGGSGGGTAAGGGSGGGGGVGGGTGGGVGGGTGGGVGGGAGGGGGGAGGGAASYAFSTVGLPACLPGPVVGLGETGGAIVGATERGCVFRQTATGLVRVIDLTEGATAAWLRGFYVSPTGVLHAMGLAQLWVCSGACEQPASWQTTAVAAGNEVLEAICGTDDAHVWLFGNRGTADDGIGYLWNGVQLATPAQLLGAPTVLGCWRSGATLYAAATGAVVRWDGAGFAPELALVTGRTAQWRGGGTVGGVERVGGLNSLIGTRADGGWALEYDAAQAGTVRAVVGVGPLEGYAFGGGASSSGQAGWRWNGLAWAPLAPDLPVMNVAHTALLASDGSLWVGGDDAAGDACLVRGAR